MIYLATYAQATILWAITLLALLAVYIWTIVDIVRSEFRNSSDKVLYLALALALPFIGSVIYWVMGRPKRIHPNYH